MVEIAIHVRGTQAEVEAALWDIAQRLRGGGPVEGPEVWTPDLIRRLWAEIRPPQARKALLLIAEHHKGLDNRVLMKELGVTDPQRLKGVFSPIGFAMKRLGITTRPYATPKGRFTMSPEIARVIREEAAR